MKVMKKLVACVDVFNHSAVNNNEAKDIQMMHEEFHVVCELIGQKVTRRAGEQKTMLRLPQLKIAIIVHFSNHPTSKWMLIMSEWLVTSEVCSLLDTISEVTTRIQGSLNTHISQMTFIMIKMVEVLKLDNHLIRTSAVQNTTM